MSEWWLLSGFLFLLVSALFIAFYPLRKSPFTVMILAPLFLGLVVCSYWRWGAWLEWTAYLQTQEKQQQVQAMLKTIQGPQDLIDKLKSRLKSEPKSARGWYLLGRLYASQGQWSLAREAFAKAHQLQPEDEQIAVNYAQSVWELNHRQFEVKSRALFHDVLLKNPSQPDALAMLAMDAFVGHAYQQAIDYWQRLLNVVPPDSADAAAIRKAIAKAQHLMEKQHDR